MTQLTSIDAQAAALTVYDAATPQQRDLYPSLKATRAAVVRALALYQRYAGD